MLAAAKARRDADAANRDGAAIAAAAAGPTQVSNPEQHSPRGEVPEAGMTNLFLSFAVHHASSSSCHKQRRSSSCYGSQHQQAQRMHRGQCRACWQQVRVCGGTKSDHSVSSSPGPPHHSSGCSVLLYLAPLCPCPVSNKHTPDTCLFPPFPRVPAHHQHHRCKRPGLHQPAAADRHSSSSSRPRRRCGRRRRSPTATATTADARHARRISARQESSSRRGQQRPHQPAAVFHDPAAAAAAAAAPAAEKARAPEPQPATPDASSAAAATAAAAAARAQGDTASTQQPARLCVPAWHNLCAEWQQDLRER